MVLSVGEVQTVAATVTAQNCEDCRIELDADPELFEAVSGHHALELGPGSFERDVEWRLRAKAAAEDAIPGAKAMARGSTQQAFLFVRIHPSLGIEG